ncbi:MAG: hypothetical protein ACP5GD_03560 [Candidatus Micrarchaeia archaeon]
MLEFVALMFASLAVFSAGFVGAVFGRHFIKVMLSLEAALLASTILLVGFVAYNESGAGLMLLILIWGSMAVEAIVTLTFYVLMKSRGIGFDVSKLNRYKW